MNVDKIDVKQNTFCAKNKTGKDFKKLFFGKTIVKDAKKVTIGTEYDMQMNERLQKLERDFIQRAKKSWIKAREMFFNL